MSATQPDRTDAAEPTRHTRTGRVVRVEDVTELQTAGALPPVRVVAADERYPATEASFVVPRELAPHIGDTVVMHFDVGGEA